MSNEPSLSVVPRGLVLPLYFALAMPALAYYPLRWLEAATRPPSRLWEFAESTSWLAVVSPVCLLLMIPLWWQLDPRATVQRFVAALLMFYTACLAAKVLGFFLVKAPYRS